MKRFEKATLAIFLGILCLLVGNFAYGLGLYLDDAAYAFPIVDKLYWQYAFAYLKDFGFSRPLVLVYYYLVYEMYLRWGGVAHILPVVMWGVFLGLVYKVVRRQGWSARRAWVGVGLIAGLPFWTEVYGWLSASHALIVYSLLLMQVWLIERSLKKRGVKMGLLLMQLISMFLYEMTVFMPIALGYLWVKRKYGKLLSRESIREYLSFAGGLSIPAFLYLGLRIIFPPNLETRAKWIGVSEVVRRWSDFGRGLVDLIWREGWQGFWVSGLIEGGRKLGFETVVLLSLLIAVMILGVFYRRGSKGRRKERAIFWLLAFCVSLVPLSWQSLYLPFRVLVLPLSLLILAAVSSLDVKRGKGLITVLVGLGLGLGLLIQVGMMGAYKRQYEDDAKMVGEINKKILALGYDYFKRTNILVTNFPKDNTLGLYTYGDYLHSIFHYDWTVRSLLGVEEKVWHKMAVEFVDGGFSSGMTKDEFLNQRPVITLRYEGKDYCGSGDCFRVAGVEQ